MTLDQNVTQIERKTYSSLEWLGDIGGLYDALKLIGHFFVYPIALMQVNKEILNQTFGAKVERHLATKS